MLGGDDTGFNLAMSESITNAALEIRQRIRATSENEEVFKKRTANVANYLILEDQLEKLDRQVSESFKEEMSKAAWFDQIKNSQMVSNLFWITKAAAEETLTKEEMMLLNTLADRIRSREIGTEKP
ncbi:hypothetical protein FX985_00612 [Pseudomonas extremaustralis]|uniref:Uncharacterized protein n=2 Tax=Pseudomonas extremaustralis TaxID=359110 RepID=A0A5M9IX01_9PSED|nr:hypothetical protein FX985_00612 [Pseudomonas extremaustralis]